MEDCAVNTAIYGPDGIDQTVYDAPFNYDPNIKLRRLGNCSYLKSDFDKAKNPNDAATLAKLRELGATRLHQLPRVPLRDISFVLSTEAAAAFDDPTRSGRDDLLVRQIANAWPNVFRTHRFVPAVEYIQAQCVLCIDPETAKASLRVWICSLRLP